MTKLVKIMGGIVVGAFALAMSCTTSFAAEANTEVKEEVVVGVETSVQETEEVVTRGNVTRGRNEYVAALQQHVNRYLFGTIYYENPNKLAEDGLYGPKTKEYTVRALQKYINSKYNAGLEEDGKFGPKTKSWMGHIAVREGDNNIGATIARNLLGRLGYHNSILDNGTLDKAIRNFQRANGLAVDGVCGQDTWRELLSK